MSTTITDRPLPVLHARLSGIAGREEFVARHIGDSIQTKPVPVTVLRRGGPRPLHVLLFGGGPVIGWGLRDHNLGLAGHLADRLASVTRRGVELEVVADEEPVRQVAIEGIRGLRLRRYDAIVSVLGQPSREGISGRACLLDRRVGARVAGRWPSSGRAAGL